MKVVALVSLFALLCPSDVFAGVHRHDASLKQYPVSRRSPPYVARVSSAHRGYYWTMSEKKAVRDYYEGILLCPVTVGTQDGLFQVIVDTTSDQSWLFSDDVVVPSDMGYARQTYLPQNSTTFVNTSQKFSTVFDSGWQASDVWKIPLTNISARMDFGVITQLSPITLFEFYYVPADGQLGLALGANNQSYLRQIRPLLDDALVSIWLSASDEMEPSKPAVITFGSFDTESCDMGNATHKPKDEWVFRFDALDLVSGSGDIDSLNISASVHIELFGAEIRAPNATVRRIASLLGAKPYKYGDYTIDCEKRRTGKTLRFRIGEDVLDISPQDYVYKQGSMPDCKLAFTEYGDTRDRDEAWSVGTRFFNSHCVYLDYERDVLGFTKFLHTECRSA